MNSSWFSSLIKLVVSIGMSVLIIALMLQFFTSGVSDSERPAILPVLQATSLGLFLVYLAFYFVGLLVRAHRYRLLLGLAGESSLPSMPAMVLVTGVRNMVVDMLPARLGELGYVGLLNRGYGVKLQHCISSLSLSVALDFIALLAIVAAIVLSQMFGSGISSWAIGAIVVASILVGIAWSGLFLFLPWIVPILLRWFTGSSKPLVINGLRLLVDFNTSLQSVYQSGHTLSLIAWSVLIRLLKYSGFYLLYLAVTSASFSELAALPINQVLSALIGGEVAASLPIPAFMSFGVYEAGSVLVFKMLGVGDLSTVLIVMLCVHLLSQVIEYVLGGLLLLVFIWQSRSTNRHRRDSDERAPFSNDSGQSSPRSAMPWRVGAALVFTLTFSTI